MTPAPPSFAEVATVVADTFMATPGKLTPKTAAADVEGWDSISNAILIVALEDRFGVRFAADEIGGFPDLGALHARVLALTARCP